MVQFMDMLNLNKDFSSHFPKELVSERERVDMHTFLGEAAGVSSQQPALMARKGRNDKTMY